MTFSPGLFGPKPRTKSTPRGQTGEPMYVLSGLFGPQPRARQASRGQTGGSANSPPGLFGPNNFFAPERSQVKEPKNVPKKRNQLGQTKERANGPFKRTF